MSETNGQGWTPVEAGCARLIWKCQACGCEYTTDPADATIPYCIHADCPNNECETEFARTEILSAVRKAKGEA